MNSTIAADIHITAGNHVTVSEDGLALVQASKGAARSLRLLGEVVGLIGVEDEEDGAVGVDESAQAGLVVVDADHVGCHTRISTRIEFAASFV
jgi:hypothetical protein